jgi:uncharacterized membrane protein
MRNTESIALGIIILSVAVSALFYSQLPDKMASHWNATGDVNDYAPKFFALAIMPVLSLVLLGLFVLIPRIDPLGKNIEKFRKQYDTFVILIIAFMAYINFVTLAWNLGVKFSLIQFLVPAFAVLFYYVGVLMEHAQPNWFVGIRTPWTLSSEKVWRKTHETGSKLFKALGIASLIGLVFPAIAIWLILGFAIAICVWSFVYSYLEFKKERKPKKKKR